MPITNMVVKQAKPLIDAVLANLNGGIIPQTAVNMEDYVSAASTVNSHDPDQVMGAITQLWGRTIFAVRPYSSMLAPLVFDTDAWSLAERKINFVSRLPSDNDAWKYPVTRSTRPESEDQLGDGLSVDQYRINKDKVFETAFYGAETWGTHRTTFRKQLQPAFRDPEELVRFNSAAVQNVQNDRETWAEAYMRGIINATIVKAANTPARVVHLVTEYVDNTGAEEGAVNADPLVHADFVRWVYARIAKVKGLMAERNTLYTDQPEGLPEGMGILRHTPADKLRMMFNQSFVDEMRTRVVSNTYNPDMLNLGDIIPVNFWLNPNLPLTVSAGNLGNVSVVVGIMFDRDALGFARMDTSVYTTPFNADGEYYNTFFKEVWKNRQDLSEKFVIFCLD